MMYSRISAGVILGVSLIGMACAEPVTNSDVGNQQPAVQADPSVQVPAALPSSEQSSVQLPKLTIRWDCSACEENAKVAPLIEEAYIAEAAKRGYAVSDAESAEIAIIGYHQRNPGARVLFGFMAGKDRLSVRIQYKDKRRTASDYAANAFQGMNALCESVGKKSLKEIVSIISSTQEKPAPSSGT